ncbi:hypothetical protein ACSS6W_000328 [Trichoderma asperelloides]
MDQHRPVWNPSHNRSAAALFGEISLNPSTLCLTLGQKGLLQGFQEGRRRSDKNHFDRAGGFVPSLTISLVSEKSNAA